MESSPAATTPADAAALLAEAVRFAQSDQLDQAIAQLKHLIEIEPKHEVGIGMLAGIYAQLGMHERAANHFLRVLEINPANALARFQFGLIQLQADRPAEALETWKPALIEESDFLLSYFAGVAFVMLDRLDEARAMFDRAERHMPKNHALYPQLLQLRERS